MSKIQKLKNGLRFITIPMLGTKTATILVMVGTGSKYEDKANNGMSHFLEHMFFKGTKKRPNALAISAELDSMGAEYNAFTSKEYTGYWIKTSKEKLEKAVDMVSDIFLNSKIAQTDIDREKGVIIEEINMYQDNPMSYVEDLFEECLYGDQPAGWDTLGKKKNILSFKRADFISYLKSQYEVKNTIVCVAGNVKGMASMLEKYFSKLKKSNFKDKIKVIENQETPATKIHYKKTDQAHLSLGVCAFSAGHKDEYIVKALSIILGGSMSSRLFLELREKRGLAYYVRTGAEFYTDCGYLATQAGVPVNKIDEAIKIILDEYRKLTKTLVNKKELQRVKDLFKGRVAIQEESSDFMASWYARQIILKDKNLSPEDFIKKISQVTAKDIQRVAKKIFVNEGLNLAIIGPYKKLEIKLEI